MATQGNNNNNNLDPTMNPASIYFLHPSDVSQKLVNEPFSGVGYGDWRRAMTIALSAKNKLPFVDGSLTKPAANSVNHKPWERVNNVVISWLIGALDPKIARIVMWYITAREIWKDLEDRFGQCSSTQLFSLQEAAEKASQTVDMSVEEFFTKMKGIWDELDAVHPLPVCVCTGCSCNLTQQFYKRQQDQRLISFLMKLTTKYAQVRSNILMMSDLPNISQAYRLLAQEQKHHELSNLSGETTESMAFNAEQKGHTDQRGFNERSYSQPQTLQHIPLLVAYIQWHLK